MNKFTILVLLVAVVLVTEVHGGKKKKKAPPVHVSEDDPFSDQEHFKDGKHDANYDHDAFLGEDQAKEIHNLTPKEVKKRLRVIFGKIDIDGDKKVSRKELYDWIVDNMKKHVTKGTTARLGELDKNKDGKVSWDEFEKDEYSGLTNNKDLPEEEKKQNDETKARDKKRFILADTDNDGFLSQSELELFVHPEESPRMTNLLVQENVEILDKDGDGLINFEEYAGVGHSGGDFKTDKEAMDSLKDHFNTELDKNKDGQLDKDEVKDWIMPGGDTDPSGGETDHLMKEADINKDNFLSVDEVVKHHELFSGGRATSYGDLLKNEL